MCIGCAVVELQPEALRNTAAAAQWDATFTDLAPNAGKDKPEFLSILQ